MLKQARQIFLPQGDLSADELAKMHEEEVRDLFLEKALASYEAREKELGAEKCGN